MKTKPDDIELNLKREAFNRLAAAWLYKLGYDDMATGDEPVTNYIYAEGEHIISLMNTAEIPQVRMPAGFSLGDLQEHFRLFCGEGLFYAYLTEDRVWLFVANMNLRIEVILSAHRAIATSEAHASLLWYLDNMEKFGEVADPYGYRKCYEQNAELGDGKPFKIPYQPRNAKYRLK